MVESHDNNLISLIVSGDKVAFEGLFKAHFKRLHAYAFGLIGDESTAEEMVQLVFIRLWERRQYLKIHTSFKSFIYRSVHNESINFLKSRRIRTNHQNQMAGALTQSLYVESPLAKMELAELTKNLRQAISELPEQCGLIFCLSRFEDLKYREIADQLGISIKTVEAQMTKAMKILKKKLVA